jgi:hypothetical protein
VTPRERTRLEVAGDADTAAPAVEAAWAAVDASYPYLRYKGIDWHGLHGAYRRRAEVTPVGCALEILTELLAELRDGHVYVRARHGTGVVPYVPPRMVRSRRTYRPDVARGYLLGPPRLTSGGHLAYGLLRAGPGYLYLPAFEPAGVAAECDEALSALRRTRALVLDNRSSFGGHRAEVYRMTARFLSRPLEGPVWYTLGERRQWPAIEPARTCRYLQRVVVLVNGLTFSAAELFTDLLSRLPAVTVLGETTAGGSAGCDADAVGEHTLPAGIRVRIPTVDGRRGDGTPWESVGVRPHVRVLQTEADLAAGRDRQLEHAIDLLASP